MAAQSISLYTIVNGLGKLASTLRSNKGSLAAMQVSADVLLYDVMTAMDIPKPFIGLVLGDEMKAIDDSK